MLRCGLLTRRNKEGKWKREFAVLKENMLYFFFETEKEKEKMDKEKLSKSLWLNGARVQYAAAAAGDNATLLKLEAFSETVEMQADTAAEASDWAGRVRAAVESVPDVEAFYNAYLEKKKTSKGSSRSSSSISSSSSSRKVFVSLARTRTDSSHSLLSG
jgi:hypothetical protein